MIFVTVGNHPQQFNRLLKKADELARDKIINDVIVQTGYSDYKPKYCNYSDFVGFNHFKDLIKGSDIIITHGGEGSIGNALLNKKIPIVVPRLKTYSEHTNDHQLQITHALEKQEKIIAVYDIQNLEKAIDKAKNLEVTEINNSSNILNLIQEHVELWGHCQTNE